MSLTPNAWASGLMADLLTVAEVAALLRVPRSWLYARTASDGPEAIPHLKLGRHLRFRRSEVEAWVEEHHSGLRVRHPEALCNPLKRIALCESANALANRDAQEVPRDQV
jgi:excisionase family DNA binding protein